MPERSAITEDPNDRTSVEWTGLKFVRKVPLSASVVHPVCGFVRLSLPTHCLPIDLPTGKNARTGKSNEALYKNHPLAVLSRALAFSLYACLHCTFVHRRYRSQVRAFNNAEQRLATSYYNLLVTSNLKPLHVHCRLYRPIGD